MVNKKSRDGGANNEECLNYTDCIQIKIPIHMEFTRNNG